MSDFFKRYFNEYSDTVYSTIGLDDSLKSLIVQGQLMILHELMECEERGEFDVIRYENSNNS